MKRHTKEATTKRFEFSDQSFLPELRLLGFDDLKEALALTEHEHDNCFEFVYIDQGRTVWQIEEQSFETKSGELFTTFPGEKHRGSFDVIEPCRFWWIIIEQPSHGTWLGLSAVEQTALIQQLSQLSRVIAINHKVSDLFEQLRLLTKERTTLALLQARILIVQLLLYFIEQPNQQPFATYTIQQVTTVIEQLSNRLDQQLTVAQLAAEANLGVTQFYHLFKDITGLTPKVYIEHLRMEEATRRLRETDDPITTIAYDLGFVTSQHFSTVFKRLKGRSPTTWRKEHC